MAELIWTEPALHDLDAIADHIALENPAAARTLVKRVFEHVEQLEAHPESGFHPPELGSSSRRYRQIVEPPCRIFYRYDSGENKVLVLYIAREERRFSKTRLTQRDRRNPGA
jgi:plasmid stabilization system protein ParE